MKTSRTVYVGVVPILAPLSELAPEMTMNAPEGMDDADMPKHGLMFVHPDPSHMEAVIVALSDNGLEALKQAVVGDSLIVADLADLRRETGQVH